MANKIQHLLPSEAAADVNSQLGPQAGHGPTKSVLASAARLCPQAYARNHTLPVACGVLCIMLAAELHA